MHKPSFGDCFSDGVCNMEARVYFDGLLFASDNWTNTGRDRGILFVYEILQAVDWRSKINKWSAAGYGGMS
jgi:hypothetical protein